MRIQLPAKDFRHVLRQGSPLSKEGAGAMVTDRLWGDRYGRLKDPFGHHWSIATHKEDVSDAEMEERAAAMFAKGG